MTLDPETKRWSEGYDEGYRNGCVVGFIWELFLSVLLVTIYCNL